MNHKNGKSATSLTNCLTKSRLNLLAPLLIIAAAIIIYMHNPIGLQLLRNSVFDQYQRWQPRTYQTNPVRIIDIDDDSLQKYGQWPWPRILVAELLDKLRTGAPKVIAFDVVFAEPDRCSPQALLNFRHLDQETQLNLGAVPNHDAVFAESIQQGSVVLGFIGDATAAGSQLPLLKAHYVQTGDLPAQAYHFSGALKSLSSLEAAAAGNGAINFVSVADDTIRQSQLLFSIGDKLLPSLAAEALRISQDTQNYIVQSSQQAQGIEQIQIGKFVIPTSIRGDIWLHYSLPAPERYIPAWKILSGEFPTGALAGQILLVGASAKGLEELKFNPLGNFMPGIEVHAQTLEQILSGEFLSRPAWANVAELTLMIIGGLLVSVVALLSSISISCTLTLLLLLGLPGLAWLAFCNYGLLLDPVSPGLTILLCFITGSAMSHFAAEKRQRWLKQAFSRYVSPNRVNYIIQHPEELQLGGQRRQCSFIFTDITDFTQLMESTDPADTVAWLNAYLNGLIAIAFKHHGTVERIVGDGIAILFSAPLQQTDHQRRALECGLEIHEFCCRYTHNFNTKNINFGQTRIGIHSGEVIVGNVGGSAMFDYRALGDPVNTAARLEKANKFLGTLVCVSATTLANCPNIPARPIGKLLLKGKSQVLMAYEPLLGKAGDSQYQQAYDLLAKHNPNAMQAFARLAELRPDDPLVNLHLKRLQTGEQGELIVIPD
jgi:adenylate cyclase